MKILMFDFLKLENKTEIEILHQSTSILIPTTLNSQFSFWGGKDLKIS